MIEVGARLAIGELYAAYAACLDERRFDEWPDMFTQECSYRIVPRENFDRGLPLATMAFESRAMLRDRVYAVGKTLFHDPYHQRHLVSGIRATHSDGGGWDVRASWLAVRTKPNHVCELFNAGRYIDHVVEDEGRLRFAAKQVVLDGDIILNALIYPL